MCIEELNNESRGERHSKYPAARIGLALLTLAAGMLAAAPARAESPPAGPLLAESGAVVPNPPPLPAPSPYLSTWFHQSLGVIGSKDIRFGPHRTNDVYLEYEYFGRKGPFDLYGYVDVPRVFGVGNGYDTGVTNKGSPLFSEQEPRVSIDDLVGRRLGFGPFKEWYVAFDWIYDQGHNTAGRQNTLYAGFGTDIDTHTRLMLSANLYVRRQWENYGAANQNSWDGYRAQMKYIYPIGTFHGGNLTYVGFFNYDFGSKLREESGGNARTDTAFVSTNVLIYSFKHWRFWTAARYFHNGGQWNGTELNFGDGPFQNRSTGWGYYASVGYQF
ncbi:nucleoside-specific channel-forming protein Tsx [Burkholderia ubonensis]|uniref:nucleoside-specific channel-forming protein Tsx n=1 Tax=Burkholderia ubonensis TaxID=101571 RepID=UPI002AB3F151|nr:nucleoside-specific channel-forming protein Tsx [Burkholderia ubonensis]MDY7792734.1 nucleoside-specific channel-forming protein Tsx [Burkholderia ubonensis]